MIGLSTMVAPMAGAGAVGVGASVSAPGGGVVSACTALSGSKAPIVPIAALARKWRRPITEWPITGGNPCMLILPLKVDPDAVAWPRKNADALPTGGRDEALRPSLGTVKKRFGERLSRALYPTRTAAG